MEPLTDAGRVLPPALVAAGIALALTAAGIAVVALATDDRDARRIEGFGLAIELPATWEGEIVGPPGSPAPHLVASNSDLPGAGEPLGGRLPSKGARLVLSDHGAPGANNFYPLERALPVTVRRAALEDCADGCFRGVQRGHTTVSYAFATGGRLFELVAIFAGAPSGELLAEANEVLGTLEVEPRPDQTPPTARRDALWIQLVLVAAGFWSWSELDPDRQWNLAVPTGGPSSLNVWFTQAARDPEGRIEDDGVRASWGAQGLTLWVEPVGDWDIRPGDLDRLVRASMRVPRR